MLASQKPQSAEPPEPLGFGLPFQLCGHPANGFVQALAALSPLLPGVCVLAFLGLVAYVIHRLA